MTPRRLERMRVEEAGVMLTEDEAKEKMCCGPLAAMSVSQGLCIGSKCMAWRSNGMRQSGKTFVPDKDLYVAAAMFPNATVIPNTPSNINVIDRMKEWGAQNEAAGRVPLAGVFKVAGVAIEWIERENAVGFCGLAGAPQ